jgi:hypothetical protein
MWDNHEFSLAGLAEHRAGRPLAQPGRRSRSPPTRPGSNISRRG